MKRAEEDGKGKTEPGKQADNLKKAEKRVSNVTEIDKNKTKDNNSAHSGNNSPTS